MVREIKPTDVIYFKCKKCKATVFRAMGAMTHSNKAHKQTITLKTIRKYFIMIKKPKEGLRYKCNACGHVVLRKGSLQGHCTKVHKKSYSQIGSSLTGEPPTNPTLSGTRKTYYKRPVDPEIVKEFACQIVKISDAKATDNGILTTLQILIPTSLIATVISPTLIKSLGDES